MLLRKRNDTLDRVKTVEFKAKDTELQINVGSILKPKTKTFYPKLQAVSWSRDNRHYLYMDIETGLTYTFNGLKLQENPADADTLNATGLIATAMRMIGSNYGLAVLAITAIAGLGFGFILGQNIEGITAAIT